MQIYTGNAFGKDLEKVKSLGMGIMICTSVGYNATKEYRQVPCAMDNGAFGCFKKGYPFQADLFLDNIKHCYKTGIPLQFLTCPDIVCGGIKSLAYSMQWAKNELQTAPRMALVVQDGMKTEDITRNIHDCFTHIFVGGSVEWKWGTARQWVDFGHDKGKQVHIGQCGTLDRMLLAYEMGADSIDSTSIVRNKSWKIVEDFYSRSGHTSMKLFSMEDCDDILPDMR